jgi:hypothetical protein
MSKAMSPRMQIHLCSLLLSPMLIVAVGCKANESGAGSTPGEQGRVMFDYQGGCLFGCPLERPLLVGTRQTISVSDAGDVAGVQITSSKPKVAEFALERACYCEREDHSGGQIDIAENASCQGVFHKHCDNSVLVQAKANGESELELRDKQGKLIDRVPVIVREAKSGLVEVTYPDRLGSVETSSIELKTGGKAQIDASFYDDMGRKLIAQNGVSWSVDDDQVASITAWLIGGGKQVDAGLGVELDAKGAGQTTLTISVPGLDKMLDVTVTAP